MAKIVKFDYDNEPQTRRKVAKVKCLWKEGQLENDEPCIILSMYNPSAKTASVSQVLHITSEVAEQLIEILQKNLLQQ